MDSFKQSPKITKIRLPICWFSLIIHQVLNASHSIAFLFVEFTTRTTFVLPVKEILANAQCNRREKQKRNNYFLPIHTSKIRTDKRPKQTDKLLQS